MDQRQSFGLIGSIVLLIGVFAPIVSIPIIGNINLFQNGRGVGVVVVVLMIISFVVTLMKRYAWLVIAGIISLCITIYTFINMQRILLNFSSQLNTELEDNPFRSIGDLAIESIQFQWGWALLIVGSGLLISAAILELKDSNNWFEVKQKFNVKLSPKADPKFGNYLTLLMVLLIVLSVFFTIFYSHQKSKSSQGISNARSAGREKGIGARSYYFEYKHLSDEEVCKKLTSEYFGNKLFVDREIIQAFESGCIEGYE